MRASQPPGFDTLPEHHIGRVCATSALSLSIIDRASGRTTVVVGVDRAAVGSDHRGVRPGHGVRVVTVLPRCASPGFRLDRLRRRGLDGKLPDRDARRVLKRMLEHRSRSIARPEPWRAVRPEPTVSMIAAGRDTWPNARPGGPPVTKPPVMQLGESATKPVVGRRPAWSPPKPGRPPPLPPDTTNARCRGPGSTARPPHHWSTSAPRRCPHDRISAEVAAGVRTRPAIFSVAVRPHRSDNGTN